MCARFPTVYTVLLLLATLPAPGYGWWDTGHMLVAQIALKYLNQRASSNVLFSVTNAVNSLNEYTDDSNTFVTTACWMDDLKSRGITQFSDWHFIDLPICDQSGWNDTSSCNGVSVNSLLQEEYTVVWAINEAISTLQSKWALGFERGFALRNLVHFVGDIHQPLHSSSRYSDQTPNGDLGGNDFPITGIAGVTELHAFWDSVVGMVDNDIDRPLTGADAAYIGQVADQIIAKTSALTGNATTYNVTEWALESRALAISFVYSNITFGGTPSDDYIAQGWEVCQQQLGLAGYRLYLVLNQIYLCSASLGNCPGYPPPPPPIPTASAASTASVPSTTSTTSNSKSSGADTGFSALLSSTIIMVVLLLLQTMFFG